MEYAICMPESASTIAEMHAGTSRRALLAREYEKSDSANTSSASEKAKLARTSEM